MKIKLSYILITLISLWLSSCSHKEILCPGTEVRQVNICFDWDRAPDASPEGMTLYFFPTFQGGMIWKFDIAGSQGGPIELPTGTYRMIAYNNDLPGVTVTDTDSYDHMTANARTIAAEKNCTSTGMLYGAVIDRIEVTPCGVSYTTAQGSIKECPRSLIHCAPDSLSTLYTVTITNVNGIERVKSASALLNGVASSLVFNHSTPLDYPATLQFPLDCKYASSQLRASACAFASPPDSETPYRLTLVVTRTDGKSFSRDFDVSQQVMNSFSPRNVIITIDGIDIPSGDITPPDHDVGGIEVDVDGWNTIEVDIESTV